MPIDPALRFDTFIVGSANRLAVAAARAVADAPGAAYNPLFMYSESGLGKTHLMSAIGNQVMRTSSLSVELVTLDDFVGELHEAIASGNTEAFQARYLQVGVLLIDDTQFLTGHPETQSELLRVFNALQSDGRQLVMTSDRPPAEIADVDARLITRLSGGLIVDIGTPDYETRMAILKAKCEQRGVHFSPSVIDEVGRVEFKNVRELQGALNRLIAFQALGEGEMTAAKVASVIGDLAEQRGRSTPLRVSTEFSSFMSDVASVVAQHVDQWKQRLSEAMSYWQSEGYRTGPLSRALDAAAPPRSVESLLREFDASVARLRDLEHQVARTDAALAAHDAFRDPDRLSEAEQLVERALRQTPPPPGPSAAFTRAGFETGTSNQLAVRAADAIVSVPGTRYNPLFIHGPSGVGKTHLLNAIGNGLVSSARLGPVACVPAQLFVDELISALQEGTVDRWRARYRAAAALLLDDVQFVAGKERTQEELFHVFNSLYADGKQLVFASDRPPRELSGLEDRLRSRFEGGLVVPMQSPDRALRERLYARCLRELGVEPTGEMLGYLAEAPVASVREIIGIANRIVASAEVAAVPVTIGFIRAELEPDDTELARAAAMRTAADTFFLDREKTIWQWPDPGARLIEEPR
jgi:chromosomal replication initiator protein DnaA